MKYKLIINLKAYPQATGDLAIKIGKVVKKLELKAKNKNVEIILCPQNIDLKDLIKLKIKVFAQHIDGYEPGAHTGYNIAENLKKIGISGSLIDHSEHLLSLDEIKLRIDLCKKLNLMSCVCARDVKIAKKIANLNPDFIAVEPKELIGGDISISTAKPELIKKSVEVIGDIELLVGAGVKNAGDVRKSIELGAKGILVASGVIKAKNIELAIIDLLEGF